MKYIVVNAVRNYAKQHGKRVGTDFLNLLNSHVHELLDAAIGTHNGGKKTLDADVFYYITSKKKAK